MAASLLSGYYEYYSPIFKDIWQVFCEANECEEYQYKFHINKYYDTLMKRVREILADLSPIVLTALTGDLDKYSADDILDVYNNANARWMKEAIEKNIIKGYMNADDIINNLKNNPIAFKENWGE